MTTRPKTDSGPLVLHRGVGSPTKCRSCKAEVVFAETTGGKLSPFQKDDEGLYVLENGVARFVGKPDAQLRLDETSPPQRWTSHFSTCPHAANWRTKDA